MPSPLSNTEVSCRTGGRREHIGAINGPGSSARERRAITSAVAHSLISFRPEGQKILARKTAHRSSQIVDRARELPEGSECKTTQSGWGRYPDLRCRVGWITIAARDLYKFILLLTFSEESAQAPATSLASSAVHMSSAGARAWCARLSKRAQAKIGRAHV